MHNRLIMAIMACLLCCGWAVAGTPLTITYQGILSDANGPVTGNRSVIFSIYDVSEGGSALWSSGLVSIDAVNGVFEYVLGSGVSILPAYVSGTDRWLGIQFPPDEEITPRIKLGSVPYAYQSLTSDTAEVGGGWKIGAVSNIHPAVLTSNVAIGVENPGDHKLYIQSDNAGVGGSAAYISNSNTDGIGMIVENNSAGLAMIVSQLGEHSGGEIFRCDSYTGGWHPVFRVMNSGRIKCTELELTGGADLAEPFEISADSIPVPGTLMVIDDNNPGKLTMSSEPYDCRVAGIVSGAGNINPAITLTQERSFGSGSNIAMSGRVYCLVDASYGAINPGDLLTTSSTPGYAMKALDRERSFGAVIGKAMTSLPEGQGLVLVLVGLQ